MRFGIVLSLTILAFAQNVDWVGQVINQPQSDTRSYKFTRTNGLSISSTSLTASITNTITVTPCPRGLNGADVTHYVYISNGTGAAEAVLITGGSCTSGLSTGTISFTPANNHSGAWTMTSASGGLQEAICAAPSVGGVSIITEAITLTANVASCGKTGVNVFKNSGVVITGAFTIFGASYNNNGEYEVYNSGPNFATLSKHYSGMRIDVGGYPNSSLFGSNITGIAAGLTGTIKIPATATYNNHSAGVAGYALTFSESASGGVGAVGVFGQGLIGVQAGGATATAAWGGNFVTTNCLSQTCTDGNGFNRNNNYGVEIDMNLAKTAGAVAAVNGRGLYITGDTTHQPSGLLIGVDIDKAGQTGSIKWKSAFRCMDGSTDICLDIGQTAAGNNAGSNPIYFRSTTAGGVVRQASQQSDSNGNLVIRSGDNSAYISLQDNSGGSVLNVRNNRVENLQTVTHFRGADVASATTTVLGTGNLFYITGTTTITNINTCDSNNTGRIVILVFNAALTVTDGGNLKLAGNFVTTIDDTLQLACDSTSWVEISRSIN